MGWRPRDVYECSVSEFMAAFTGWRKANGAAEQGLTEDDVIELQELMAGYDPNVR